MHRESLGVGTWLRGRMLSSVQESGFSPPITEGKQETLSIKVTREHKALWASASQFFLQPHTYTWVCIHSHTHVFINIKHIYNRYNIDGTTYITQNKHCGFVGFFLVFFFLIQNRFFSMQYILTMISSLPASARSFQTPLVSDPYSLSLKKQGIIIIIIEKNKQSRLGQDRQTNKHI